MSSSIWNRAAASLSRWWGRLFHSGPLGSSSVAESASNGFELPPADHISVGRIGEAIALMHLRQLGFRLLEKNFRVLGGEIDLIMVDREPVVFVEVKSLVTTARDHPGEAVDEHKQRVLTRGALAYLKKRGWLERAARFDVVTVQFSQHPKLFVDAATKKIDIQRLMTEAVCVEHFPNAFEATGDSFYG
jgi:putative endonuclease